MRATVCLLLVVCLGLAGCKNSGRTDGLPPAPLGSSGGGSGGSFRPTPPLTGLNTPPPGAEGLLAGQVLDSFNKHPDNVSIQIVDLQDSRPSSRPIEVEPLEKGYFTIQGLQVGRHYQLIARVKDGNKLLSGTTLAVPPNPRVTIFLSEDNTTDTTPPLPGPPGLPEKRRPAPGGAVIEAPKRMDPAPASDGENPPHRGASTPAGGGPVIPAPRDGNVPNSSNPQPRKGNATNVAEGNDFKNHVPPSVSIGDNPRPRPKEEPPVPPKDDDRPPIVIPAPRNPDKPADSVHAPEPAAGPTPSNSCVLVGKKLEDFALTDLEGDPWQYKRDHKGQVVLLDFWSSGNDLAHVHQLTKLQKSYGSYGLEVVGIAYERGEAKQQASNVRSIRGRYTLNYTTILGGAADVCQVKKQFDVTQLPTLILLDERGQIIYRTEALEKPQMQELETEIRKRLGVVETLPRAEE